MKIDFESLEQNNFTSSLYVFWSYIDLVHSQIGLNHYYAKLK